MNQLIGDLKTCQLNALGSEKLSDTRKAELSKVLKYLRAKEYWETYSFQVRDIVSRYFTYLENPRQEQIRLQLMSDQQRENEITKDAAKITEILFS